MGKTNLCENRAQKRYDHVAGMIKGGLERRHMKAKNASSRTGIPERTVSYRLQHPETIRLSDLYEMADLADLKIIIEYKHVLD